jgi:hypothetical protein
MTIDLNDTYIKRWLSGLSKGTKKTYPKLLVDWLTFIKLTPTEQINKRMHDLTSVEITERCFFEDNWRSYKEALEATGTNTDSKVHDRIKAVSSFFTRNSLPLSLKKGDWKSTQKQEVKEQKLKINLKDVKDMYGHANLRDKCLLLILSQSGFSEIDISELKIETIKGLYEMAVNEHYFIEKPREKNSHIQQTCLSYEFLHDLRALLSERGNPTTGYIFTQLTGTKGTKDSLASERQAIDVRRIHECMKTLAEKTFGKEKIKGTETLKAKEFETRMLRSFYNSALLKAKIQPQELKNRMMGHDIGTQGHYDCDETTIREAYNMAFENLTINGLQSREDTKRIEEKYDSIVGKQQVQIEELKKSIEGLYHIVQSYPTELKHTLLNTEKGKIEEYTETVNNPTEEKESIKKFQKKIKDISNKQ